VKFLRKIFDNAHTSINKSEKTKKFWPLIDSFDTLMFTPDHTTKSGAHLRDAIDLKRTMMFVIIALIPCLLFGMYNIGDQHYAAWNGGDGTFFQKFGYGALRVLPMVAVSYMVGLGVEFIFAIRNGHSVQEGYLVSGMLIPLIMPIDAPLWMVAVAVIFAVVIGKEVFGGTGMNIINIALTARAFMFFAHPTSMTGDKVWVANLVGLSDKGELADGFSGATSLGYGASAKADYVDGVAKIAEGNRLIEVGDPLFAADAAQYLAKGAEMKETANVTIGKAASLWDSFIGSEIGCIGETSALACLIGAAFLLWVGIASWKVMASFFLGGLSIAGLLYVTGRDLSTTGNPFYAIDPLRQLMFGGFMFGMVFMITDPVTASQTGTGKFFYGFIGGALGILIRMANPAYPEGVMLGILIANVCAPTIDHMVLRANVQRRMKRLKTA
jgi:Na+-transporting NADH:ubiquinone oxidoreductase subunit B